MQNNVVSAPALSPDEIERPVVPAFVVVDDLDRVGIDLDALALGDYHKPEEDVVDGVPVWYAGSTERCSLTEEEPRSVSLLEIEDGSIRRRKHELDTREFAPISIEFSEGDAHGRLNDVLDQDDLEDVGVDPETASAIRERLRQ